MIGQLDDLGDRDDSLVVEQHPPSSLISHVNNSSSSGRLCAPQTLSIPSAAIEIDQGTGLFCTEIFAPEHALKGLHHYTSNRKLLGKSREHLWDSHVTLRIRFLGGSEYVQNLVRGIIPLVRCVNGAYV